MGFRVLLIAISGKEPGTIHDELGVVPTQQFEESAESPVVGVSLSNGSYLLYINDSELTVPRDDVFARLSKNARLLACYANETCMESIATSWENGLSKWSVHHDSQQGIEHLETSGTLPSQFFSIRKKALAQQKSGNDTDYVFDIPVELAKEVGGFRYDCDIEGAEGKPFQVLEQGTGADNRFQQRRRGALAELPHPQAHRKRLRRLKVERWAIVIWGLFYGRNPLVPHPSPFALRPWRCGADEQVTLATAVVAQRTDGAGKQQRTGDLSTLTLAQGRRPYKSYETYRTHRRVSQGQGLSDACRRPRTPPRIDATSTRISGLTPAAAAQRLLERQPDRSHFHGLQPGMAVAREREQARGRRAAR